MKKLMYRVVSVSSLLLTIASASTNLVAQDKLQQASMAPTASAPKAGTPSSDTKAQPKKFTGRLPRYFGNVVDLQQRQAIYQIQQSYREQIAAIEKQLVSLREEQLLKVEAVLTKEQLAQVKQLRERARAKLAPSRPDSSPQASSP